jgi:hypothetical protein
MKKMVLVRLFAAVAAVVLLCGFGGGTPIYDVRAAAIPPGPAVSMEAIEKAVIRAGLQLGWQIVPKGPGQIEGVLVLRTHRAVVDITYDTKAFNIVYKDSVNLSYDAERKTIHSNYNGWIKNLEKAIRVQASVL